jgi:hypothetical protein
MPTASATSLTPTARGVRPSFRITNPRRIQGGQLIGTFDLTMPSGLILSGCKLFCSSGTLWVKAPDAPRVDRDGRAMLRPDGKRHYDDCVWFVTTERRDRWREQVLAALAVDAPELLELANASSAPSARPPAPRLHDTDLNDTIPF